MTYKLRVVPWQWAFLLGAAIAMNPTPRPVVCNSTGNALVQLAKAKSRLDASQDVSAEDVEMVVVSYNLYWWNVGSNNRWQALWNKISDEKPFDLIGFQECEDVEGTVRSSGLSGFDYWQGPNKPQSNPAPIAWNTAVFSKVSGPDGVVSGPGSVKVGEDQYGDRIVTWVRLEHLATKRTVFFANTHGPLGGCGDGLGNNWVSSVTSNKLPGDVVIMTGDFNCGSGSPAMQKIQSLLPGGVDGGIDFILTQGIDKISGGSSNGYPSDHPLIKGSFQFSSGGQVTPSPPLPTPSPPVSLECGVELDNFDYKGGDLKYLPDIGSALECSIACRQENGCEAYTWAKAWDGCYLKSSAVSGTADPCCVSGSPACPETPSPSPSSSLSCSSFATWPDVDVVTCDACTALVLTAPYGGKCKQYCESFGHRCVSAAEEVDESCAVLKYYGCDESISDTSDMLCQCEKDALSPTPSPSPTPLPTEPMSWDAAYIEAEMMLAKMTNAEKHSLMRGIPESWDAGFYNGYYVGNTPAILRLGIPSLNMYDAGNGFSTKADGLIGTVTCFPSQLAMAATWNTELVSTVAAAIAKEFEGKGSNVILGPSINVHRVARNGRNFEYLSGEDPYLGATLVKAWLDGAHSRPGMITVAKHAFLNHQETNRHDVSSTVDEKTLWELYYPPWKAAVDAGVGSVMCAYNRIDGIYSCSSNQRMNVDLKTRMGFRGFVMSDWWAAQSTSAVKDGLDQVQPGNQDGLFSSDQLSQQPQSAIDESAKRILATMYHRSVFGRGTCTNGAGCVSALGNNVATEAHASLAHEAATSSVVLLQNLNAVLPVSTASVQKIAVVGSAQAAPTRPQGSRWFVGDYYSGGGSGHITASQVITPLDGIRDRAAELGIEVISTLDKNQAASIAQQADLTIVVGATSSGESEDRPNLRLDDGVDELIVAVSAVSSRTIVLAQSPGALVMPWRQQVDAIAIMFLGGQATGSAWASIIFGDAVPTGRLPVTIPESESDTIAPSQSLSVNYDEGLATSYRNKRLNAAFPFGHGLTYTQFAYGVPTGWLCGSSWCIEVEIKNEGPTAAPDVVQLYLEFPEQAGQPSPILKGFRRTQVLQPNEVETISFEVTPQDLSYYSPQLASWVQVSIESCTAHIGASSSDIRHSVAGKDSQSISTTVTSTQTVTGISPSTTSLTTPLPFTPVDGGDGRACRGASASDNLEEYYQIFTGVSSIEDCKAKCIGDPECKGIEHNSGSGRCEVWVRPEGIDASVPFQGYTCLRYGSMATTTPLVTPLPFTPVDGGDGRACRGASASDNLEEYYQIFTGVSSIEDCKAKCIGDPECKGIEHNSGSGRCEVWVRPGGIDASVPFQGYTCLNYGSTTISD